MHCACVASLCAFAQKERERARPLVQVVCVCSFVLLTDCACRYKLNVWDVGGQKTLRRHVHCMHVRSLFVGLCGNRDPCAQKGAFSLPPPATPPIYCPVDCLH